MTIGGEKKRKEIHCREIEKREVNECGITGIINLLSGRNKGVIVIQLGLR